MGNRHQDSGTMHQELGISDQALGIGKCVLTVMGGDCSIGTAIEERRRWVQV